MKIESKVDSLGTTLLIKQVKELKAKAVMPKARSNSKGFIRVKYIHGRPYYYLVKSFRIAGKVRQKVIKYLGSRKPRTYEASSN